jgi:hypothetical protein
MVAEMLEAHPLDVFEGENLDVDQSDIYQLGKADLIGSATLLCFGSSLGWHLVEMMSVELCLCGVDR